MLLNSFIELILDGVVLGKLLQDEDLVIFDAFSLFRILVLVPFNCILNQFFGVLDFFSFSSGDNKSFLPFTPGVKPSPGCPNPRKPSESSFETTDFESCQIIEKSYKMIEVR